MNEQPVQERSIAVPPQRMRLIKAEWIGIYTPIVEYGKLQIRFNLKTKTIDLRTCESTADASLIDRAACFIQSVINGFKVSDAVAIMKFKDVFTDTFELHEIRKMKNSHLSRAIGRIIGRGGRTKESIENFSKCRIVLHDQRVHLLGCHENIKIAKDGIGRLVQGSEPTSIFNRLRIISNKIKDKYGCIQTIYEDLH